MVITTRGSSHRNLIASDKFSSFMTGKDKSLQVPLARAHVKAGLIDGEVFVAGMEEGEIAAVAVWFAPGHVIFGRYVVHKKQRFLSTPL
jgi:hypothetical protein